MTRVRFLGLKAGAPAEFGSVEWDGASLRVSDQSLEWVLSHRATLSDGETIRAVTADEPEAFLGALQDTYRSPYFYATAPEGDNTKTLPPEMHRFGPAAKTPLRQYSKPISEQHPVVEPEPTAPAPKHEPPAVLPSDEPEPETPKPAPPSVPSAPEAAPPLPEPPKAKPSLKKQRGVASDEGERPAKIEDLQTPANVAESLRAGRGGLDVAPELMEHYRKAVTSYVAGALWSIRRKQPLHEEDMEYATNSVVGDFMSALLVGDDGEEPLIAGYDQGQGRFRDFLLKKLQPFISHHQVVVGDRVRTRMRERAGVHGEAPGEGRAVRRWVSNRTDANPEDVGAAVDAEPDADARAEWFAANRDAVMIRAWERLEEAETNGGALYHTVLHYKESHPDENSAKIAAGLSSQLGREVTRDYVMKTAQRARKIYAEGLLRAAEEMVKKEGGDEDPLDLLANLDLLSFVKEYSGPGKPAGKSLESYEVKGPPAVQGVAAPKPPQTPKAPVPSTVQTPRNPPTTDPDQPQAPPAPQSSQDRSGPTNTPGGGQAPTQPAPNAPVASAEHPAALPPGQRSPAEAMMLQIHAHGTDDNGVHQLAHHLSQLSPEQLTDLHGRYGINTHAPAVGKLVDVVPARKSSVVSEVYEDLYLRGQSPSHTTASRLAEVHGGELEAIKYIDENLSPTDHGNKWGTVKQTLARTYVEKEEKREATARMQQVLHEDKELDAHVQRLINTIGADADDYLEADDEYNALYHQFSTMKDTTPEENAAKEKVYIRAGLALERKRQFSDPHRVQRAHAALALPPEQQAPVEVVTTKATDPNVVFTSRKGAEFLKTLLTKDWWKDRYGKPFSVNVAHTTNGRARYTGAAHGERGGTIFLDPFRQSVSSAVHELGHHLEDNPRVLAAALAFQKARTGHNPLISLAKVNPKGGHKEYEVARDDDFGKLFPGDPVKALYVGRDYNGTGTEIISVGMELLYDNPVRFARVDPQFFKFMIAVLRGKFT